MRGRCPAFQAFSKRPHTASNCCHSDVGSAEDEGCEAGFMGQLLGPENKQSLASHLKEPRLYGLASARAKGIPRPGAERRRFPGAPPVQNEVQGPACATR